MINDYVKNDISKYEVQKLKPLNHEKTSIIYLTWKTRIERPHQTCFLKKDMQTEETTCFWFLDRQYKKCISLRFGTYSCLSHEVG